MLYNSLEAKSSSQPACYLKTKGVHNKMKRDTLSNSPAASILNKKTWKTATGEVLDPKTEMEESHIRNTLHFLYVKRAFFLMQATTEQIRQFTPDEFFSLFIKNSILWNTLLEALEMPLDQDIIFYESLEKVGNYSE